MIDESWCHLDPLCYFSSSVAWFQSTIPLVVHHLLHLEVSFPISFKEYKTCQLLHTVSMDKRSPKLSCILAFSCNISSSEEGGVCWSVVGVRVYLATGVLHTIVCTMIYHTGVHTGFTVWGGGGETQNVWRLCDGRA